MSLQLSEGWVDNGRGVFHYVKISPVGQSIWASYGESLCLMTFGSEDEVYPLAERPPWPLVCPDCLKEWERSRRPAERAVRYVGR